MEKILKSLKTNTLVSSLIWAALGLVILIWTDVSIRLLCYFLGAVLIIQGIASGISYFKLKEENLYRTFGILFGAVLLAAGIWAAARPDMFQSLIPVSYTHLDVYKRQNWEGPCKHPAVHSFFPLES